MHVGSHVEDIVNCLVFVRGCRRSNTPVEEVINEVEVRLCELMQQMITSPLTGKMFAIQPQEYVTPSEMARSLDSQTFV